MFARALVFAGQTDMSVQHLEKAVELSPDWAAPSADVAWLLATSQDAANASRAVQLAERAAGLEPQNPTVLDALAAASAAAGSYDRAVSTLESALTSRAIRSRESLEERLAMYREGKPYVVADSRTSLMERWF